jgi:TRAP-type mannitol/chloroaromatic compound transport system substrate-binding protein
MFRSVLGAAAAVALGAVATAQAADRTLQVQTSQNAGDFTFQYLSEKWVPRLEQMSGGTLTLELLPTGSVVPHRETLDAVANGILDGHLTATSYFTGKEPAYAIFADFIAAYDNPDQQQTFCNNFGGEEMLQKIHDQVTGGRVQVVGCSPYTREALVSAVPIRSVADLEGVKIRSPEGLASEVFKRAGATPVAIPFSEIYTSLEKGVIDAADASAYANNDATGLNKIANYPIFPGIHSQAGLEFTVNKATWDDLSDAERAILDTWHVAAFTDLRRHAHLVDLELVARDRAGGSAVEEVVDWPQVERNKFREIAKGAWADVAERSELAQEAYQLTMEYLRLEGMVE